MTTPPHIEDQLSRQAMLLMEQHNVVPNPENYTLWFHYAQGKNKELIAEIESIIKNDLHFRLDTCAYLHNKYIVAARNQKVLDDSALAAQKLLLEVLNVVNGFAGAQKSYTKDVDHYITDITKDIDNPNVRELAKNIVTATASLKESGEKISDKLEESTKEISSLKQNLQQVTIEAQRDFLTGVFNRKTFEKMFDENAMIAKEKQKELCLIMIDIDHFKRFNDKFGHLLGDEVLKTVARTLTDSLKGRDVVARFGGEEFIVILPDTSMENAMRVADIIRTAIADKELKRKDTGQTFGSITVSMGVARLRADKDTLPTLIKRADDALYQSKHNGRNQVTRAAD